MICSVVTTRYIHKQHLHNNVISLTSHLNLRSRIDCQTHAEKESPSTWTFAYCRSKRCECTGFSPQSISIAAVALFAAARRRPMSTPINMTYHPTEKTAHACPTTTGLLVFASTRWSNNAHLPKTQTILVKCYDCVWLSTGRNPWTCAAGRCSQILDSLD